MAKPIDLSNQKFGRLTVISKNKIRSNRPRNKRSFWDCLCECGENCIVSSAALRNGLTKSCGCLRNETLSKINVSDLLGKTFGKLTVISQNKKRHSGSVVWKCQCECGKVVNITSFKLNRGQRKSCGCDCFLTAPFRKELELSSEQLWMRKLFSKTKGSAKARRLEFSLNEDFKHIKPPYNCFYCGLKDEKIGIDRINSNIGYTNENSVLCCKFCNYAKNQFPIEEFLKYLDRIHNLKEIPSLTIKNKLLTN